MKINCLYIYTYIYKTFMNLKNNIQGKKSIQIRKVLYVFIYIKFKDNKINLFAIYLGSKTLK